MNLAIKTKNLTKKYKDFEAVKCLNLSIPKGKIYGLLGRNGAGKTTLMKMILGLLYKSEGDIFILGKNIEYSSKEIYKNIGSIIETPAFYENLTAYENLKIVERIRGNKDNKKIYEALEAVGLEKEVKKTFSEYSLGMKQRLGIAAAIVHEPKILILDEPINGLDPIGILEIRNFLLKLKEEKGTTILISSHLLSEIDQVADIVGIINDGVLIKEMTIEELRLGNRKYLEFEVSNPIKAKEILTKYYDLKNIEIIDNLIRIHSFEIESYEINKILVKEEILVSKINLKEDSLEDYFSKIIGGRGIA